MGGGGGSGSGVGRRRDIQGALDCEGLLLDVSLDGEGETPRYIPRRLALAWRSTIGTEVAAKGLTGEECV